MTNIPLTGTFKVTCEFKRKGNWKAGFHTGIDLYSDNKKIYGTCNGEVFKTGFDKSYGNYVVVKSFEDGTYHWFCHLSKINVKERTSINRGSIIGIMGNTGNSTGTHLHYEIRKECNCYGKVNDPALYMGIPNKVGTYNTGIYQISNNKKSSISLNDIKKLKSPTNLRNEPTINSSEKTLYIENTTVIILEKSCAYKDGFTWDKVKININGKIGYMINLNYK